MRLLIYGINYAPELTGIGRYTGEMCAWLAQKGHTVHVVTAMPYYPAWSTHTQYRSRAWFKEQINGVTVYRCPIYVPKKLTPLKRVIHELSFVLSSFPIWVSRLFSKRYDAVVSVSPPFHLGFFPLLYSFIRHTPVLNHIQDLQVDAAKEMGMIKNKKLLGLFFRAEKFVLRHCNGVSTISEGMKKKVMAKGIPLSKCSILPNWVDEQTIVPLSQNQSLRGEFNINPDDKVVLYSGNLGEKQGLENIVEAATAFQYRKELKFVIVGSGAGHAKLHAEVEHRQLKNVLFFPLQAYEKLSALLAIADVHLVLQKNAAQDLVMPSKLSTILAAGGLPLVTASPGSNLYEIITENRVGIVIEPDNVNALISGIHSALIADKTDYSANARRYAEVSLSRKNIMGMWERQLYGILLSRRISREFRKIKGFAQKEREAAWPAA